MSSEAEVVTKTESEDGNDDQLFLDDGFSIVDSINVGSETNKKTTSAAENQEEETDDGKEHPALREETLGPNSERVVSDDAAKKEETTRKHKGAEIVVKSKAKPDEEGDKKVQQNGDNTKKNTTKKETPSSQTQHHETKTEKETKSTITKENSKDAAVKENSLKEKKKEGIVASTPKVSKSSNVKDSKDTELTLILSNDEDLGPDISSVEEAAVKKTTTKTTENNSSRNKLSPTCKTKPSKKDESKEECDVKPKSTTKQIHIKSKNMENNFVWVSNISRMVKASGLKKHFSECGKVNTAKVVTNGKLFFGYVQFDTAEIASSCVKSMNNTVLNARKITVSKNRPDIARKESKAAEAIKQTPPPSKVVETVAKKTEREKSVRDDPLTMKCDESKKKSENERRKQMEQMIRDLDRAKVENRNVRRRLVTEQKRAHQEQVRADKLRIELRELSVKLKNERTNCDIQVTKATKRSRLEQEKLELERATLLKERDELRRRRDDLDREFKKLDDAKKSFERAKRQRKSRSSSPQQHIPPKRFRGMTDHRSPPPPPKLSMAESRSSKHLPDRPFYEEKKPRNLYERLGDYHDKVAYAKEVNGRHARGSYQVDVKSTVVGPQKASWGPPAPSDQWKRTTAQTSFQKPFIERYATSSSTYQVPPMTYYPQTNSSDYVKHGHYDNVRKY